MILLLNHLCHVSHICIMKISLISQVMHIYFENPSISLIDPGEGSQSSVRPRWVNGCPDLAKYSGALIVTVLFALLQNYVEKVLKISQKPDTYYGFGFTLHGGKETGQPITVKYVTPGSAADLCELLLGDEILRINGADVKSHYLESVMHVVEGAAKDGQLDLRIRRYYGNGNYWIFFCL